MMSGSKSHMGEMVWSFVLTAAACLTSGTAAANCTAQPPFSGVPCKLIVQPIDLCANDGSLCAPFNLTSKVGNPNNTDQTKNPIGFVDATTGKDVTRVMLNQFGVDVTYLPVARYNSMTFQTLNVIQDLTNTQCPFPGGTQSGFTSCDFLTLSQQPRISLGTVPNPTNPAGVPVGPNGVANVFFVNTLNPVNQQGSTLYGFSWIGNNGVAIGKNTFFPTPPLRPRFDNLGHELLHALGGTHDMFGANGVASNMGAAGASGGTDLRIVPSSPGCSAPSSTNPNGGALYDLDIVGLCPSAPPSPIADQLTLHGQFTPSQQDVAIGNVLNLPGSGLLTNVPNATVGVGTGGDAATATSTSSASAAPKAAGVFFFVMLPKGVRFTSTLKETFTSGVADWDISNGNNGWARGFCDPATQCLLVDFKPPGLQANTANSFVEFTIGLRGDPTGGKIRFIYAPDTFTNVSEIDGFGFSGSQFPDTTSPAGFLDPTQIAASTSLACTPVGGVCVNPQKEGISDTPFNEGGQLHSGGP
jgi:hypothetical protein